MADLKVSETFVHELASLPRVTETSVEKVLQRITTVVVRGLPQCSGATVQILSEGMIRHTAASHSELLLLLEREQTIGRGPWLEAVTTGRRVVVTDALRDDRWPNASEAALSYGVRSLAIVPFKVDETVILGLYSVRPGTVADGRLADLLSDHIAVALRNARDHGEALANSSQMAEALSSRAAIDQAKGIIMHARSCDADEAFDELRRISQEQQMKVAEVAMRLIQEQRR